MAAKVWPQHAWFLNHARMWKSLRAWQPRSTTHQIALVARRRRAGHHVERAFTPSARPQRRRDAASAARARARLRQGIMRNACCRRREGVDVASAVCEPLAGRASALPPPRLRAEAARRCRCFCHCGSAPCPSPRRFGCRCLIHYYGRIRIVVILSAMVGAPGCKSLRKSRRRRPCGPVPSDQRFAAASRSLGEGLLPQ